MEKLFPSSEGFLPLRGEREVQDISQDPDFSCLAALLAGANVPTWLVSHVLGNLVRHDQLWGSHAL